MNTNTKKAVAVAGVASLALLGGAYATFTATDTAGAQAIESGTVSVSFGETFDVPIENIAAGDTVTRDVVLTNTGTIGLEEGSVVLSKNAVGGTLLTTGALGVSVEITDDADRVVLPSTLVSTFDADIPLDLTAAQRAAGGTSDLTFSYTLDPAATNQGDATTNYSGLNDSVTFQVDATQRDGQTFVDGNPDGQAPAGTVAPVVTP